MCALTAARLGVSVADIIVASTGVIGQHLDISPIAAGMDALAAGLSRNVVPAAEAILTTDTKMKSVPWSSIWAAKPRAWAASPRARAMIHPNMATMLVFLTTDAAISPRDAAKGRSRRM